MITETAIKSDGLRPIEAILYDVIIDKEAPALRDTPAAETARTVFRDIGEPLNDVTIREMLSGVKDTQGVNYFEQRKSPNLEVVERKRDDSKDTGFMDMINSPNVVAERYLKFRPFFKIVNALKYKVYDVYFESP